MPQLKLTKIQPIRNFTDFLGFEKMLAECETSDYVTRLSIAKVMQDALKAGIAHMDFAKGRYEAGRQN